MTNDAKSMPAVAYRENLPIEDPASLLDLELPVPTPGPRDLLVRVEAVAVNPVDYKIRQNAGTDGEPRVLGWDAAGTVVAVGEEVELFAVGDDVFYAGALTRPGANAQFHAVDERIVGRKPETLSFTEAAALPLTSLTAWEGLFDHLKAEDATGTLLVTAAAGGVGAMVAQLARAKTRLTVIGTASRPESADFAKRMGAHQIVDHRKSLGPQLAEAAPDGLDYVFSTTGTDDYLPAYAEALKPFGAIVAIDDVDAPRIGVLKAKSIAFHWEFMFTRSMFATPDQQEQHRILTEVAHLIDKETLQTTATQDLGPLNATNLREAHRLQESGSVIGKLTLTGF